MRYDHLLSTTPQKSPISTDQVKNNAGGFVWKIDIWDRLDRFLILGSDAPTYYQDAPALTRENAQSVSACWADNAERTADRIERVSVEGRAPKNDPAIFALALGAAHSDVYVRRLALSKLNRVCRTSTHLFQFVAVVRGLGRGWGRTLKRAVADWYTSKSVNKVAYQAVKYRSREGYTHKRLLQTAHPNAGPDYNPIFQWILGNEVNGELPEIIRAHEKAMKSDANEIRSLAKEHHLPWEALPTEALNDPVLWRDMLPYMGLTAMLRNLGKMTAINAIKPLDESVQIIHDRLTNQAELKKARVHPFHVLQALAVYRSGRGVRGALSWNPINAIGDTLDEAYDLAFKTIEPTGARTLIALDVSGSMGWVSIGSCLDAREASAAMAMATMRVEKNWHVTAFSNGIVPIGIRAKDSLTGVLRKVNNLPFDGTDCALPILYALKKGLSVDTFVIYTDNETWFGNMHPAQALKQYRQKTGINSKLVVVGMTSTGFSIADPNDPGMLDVVGFDSNCPALIADFGKK